MAFFQTLTVAHEQAKIIMKDLKDKAAGIAREPDAELLHRMRNNLAHTVACSSQDVQDLLSRIINNT